MPAVKWLSVSFSPKGVPLTRPSPIPQSVPGISKYNEERKQLPIVSLPGEGSAF